MRVFFTYVQVSARWDSRMLTGVLANSEARFPGIQILILPLGVSGQISQVSRPLQVPVSISFLFYKMVK